MLTFEEKQLLAQISDIPTKEAVLQRLSGLQTNDTDAAALSKSLAGKMNSMNDMAVFAACADAQSLTIDSNPEEESSILLEQESTNLRIAELMEEICGGDAKVFYADLNRLGYKGFLENIGTYPQNVQVWLKGIFEYSELLQGREGQV